MPTGNPQHPGDLAAQLELSLDNLEAVLAAADMTLANVVRLNFYARDVDELFKQFSSEPRSMSPICPTTIESVQPGTRQCYRSRPVSNGTFAPRGDLLIRRLKVRFLPGALRSACIPRAPSVLVLGGTRYPGVSWTIGIVRPVRPARSAVARVRGEDAIGQPPQPVLLLLVLDDLRAERQSPERDVGMGAQVVKPGRVLGQAQLRGDDRHAVAVVEVDDAVAPQPPVRAPLVSSSAVGSTIPVPTRLRVSRNRSGSIFHMTLFENEPIARVPRAVRKRGTATLDELWGRRRADRVSAWADGAGGQSSGLDLRSASAASKARCSVRALTLLRPDAGLHRLLLSL